MTPLPCFLLDPDHALNCFNFIFEYYAVTLFLKKMYSCFFPQLPPVYFPYSIYPCLYIYIYIYIYIYLYPRTPDLIPSYSPRIPDLIPSYPGFDTLVPWIWYPLTSDLIPWYPVFDTLLPRIWYPRTPDLGWRSGVVHCIWTIFAIVCKIKCCHKLNNFDMAFCILLKWSYLHIVYFGYCIVVYCNIVYTFFSCLSTFYRRRYMLYMCACVCVCVRACVYVYI